MGHEFPGGQPLWRRKCESGACVEIAVHNDAIMVRSSAIPDMAITLTREEWRNFLAGAKEGFYDEL